MGHCPWYKGSVIAIIPAIIYIVTSSNGTIFPRYWPFVREFTDHQWIPLTEASDAEFRCFLWSAPWITGWVNNREAADLRRYRAPYDVIVMTCVWRVHSRTSAKTHWTLNIMAKFLPTFSNAFPSLKPFQWSSIITHSNMFLKFKLAIIHH